MPIYHKMAIKSYFALSILLFLFSSADANTKPIHRGVTLQLIHRFSPSLPFHKTDSFQNFIERNDEHYLKGFASFQRESTDVQLITPTSTREHLFFVNLSIGEPPVTQYLAMDTGSRLTWVTGDAFEREFMYSPRLSSTQSNITCKSGACKNLGYCINSTDPTGNCMVQTGYGDGQHQLESYLTYDRFVFQNATVDKVIMGIYCNGKGSMLGEENFYGIFGLSPPRPSFVHWLHNLGAKKFSYYINGVVTDPFHPYAGLTLGDEADMQGNTTPLQIDTAHYRLSLKSISLGRKKLDIDPKVFAHKSMQGGTGVIIDSGSVKTWLADDAYDVVRLAVLSELVQRGFDQRKQNTKNFCFYGFVEQVKRSDFPILSFNFAGGASLKLDEDDLFIDSILDYFCMTVMPSSTNGPTLRKLTVIGLTAQQDYIMGFDLENQRLSMKLSNL